MTSGTFSTSSEGSSNPGWLTTRWSPGSTPGQADPASSAISDEGVLAGPLSSRPLGGWFNRSILYNSDMSVVKEHMLIHCILPKKEERC